ncbi:translation initiation factor IF-2 [uncultured Dialister sp.]|uniref:translation initiation factor IF-2 n=1 Tax=uncultured Dialister sp. TaxID=278064 RepID=UPI00261EFA3B|nr:translation initiation factor IF-2 [uncultured Dialister sp.]
MQKKKRVYELAREFGKTDKEVLEVLKKNNIDVTSRLSSVDDNGHAVLAKAFAAKKKPARRPMIRTVRFDQQGRPTDRKNREVKQQSSYSSIEVPEEPKPTPKPVKKVEEPKPVPKVEAKPARRAEEPRQERKENRPRDEKNFHTRDSRNERQGERNRSDRNDRPQRDSRNRTESGRPSQGRNDRNGNGRNDRNDRSHQDRRPNDRNSRPAPVEEKPAATQRRENPAKKKTKKDWERSRREKEGGSLMARSLNQTKKKKHMAEKKAVTYPTEVELPPSVTVKELADLFGREVSEVIKHLMMDGVMATINQNLDRDTVEILAEEFGVKLLEPKEAADPTEYTPAPDDPRFLKPRPAVVTIMGHVDHGKTTLLDALRQTNVAMHEAGGITQRIGAYQIRYKGHKITFLDTPGHEAFTAMRSRGAQITDIAVLIVAADDGVMPQTIEAIHHAKNAKVPIMVAINKIDKPGANPDRIKEELSKEGLLAEDWGGDVIMTPISAKKKIGLDDLLENILLVAEMQELKANPNREAYGVVVEAQLDKGRGPVMSVLVQNGTLHVGDGILAGKCWGRVRAMTNENGRKMKSAEPSAPAEILGMDSVPEAGDHFYVMDEKKARAIAELRASKAKEEEQRSVQKVTLDNIFEKIKEGEMKELDIIIKADVQGSVEALVQSLTAIKSDEVRISIVHSAVGAINESDVMLASASHALIIGFNVRPDANARAMAEKDGVDIRLYRVIYDCIDDVKAAMAGMLEPTIREVLLGHAEVRQVIHTPKVIVAGSYVQDGKVTSTCQLRLIRDGIVIHEGKIASLRRFKDDVKEVAAGFECGIAIDSYRDVKEGDQLEAFELKEEAAKLE